MHYGKCGSGVWLRIPTGKKRTSWILVCVAEDLNAAPASGQGGNFTRGLQITSQELKPFGHAASRI